MKDFLKKLFNKIKNSPSLVSVLSSLMAIALGLFLGFIMLLILKPEDAVYGFNKMITAAFSSPDKIGKLLYVMVPVLLTGLSVAFAYKTGLFNIGAPGQYLLGTFFALFFAFKFNCPWYICILAAGIAGGIWGAIPGIFKAFLNVNEVITSIMFNWIGLYLITVLMYNTPTMLAYTYGSSAKDRTASVATVKPLGTIPKLNFDSTFGNYCILAVIISVIIAIICYVIINKTTFGYELRACGCNKEASKYAGIKSKRNIVLSMSIAGVLGGLAGGIYHLMGNADYVLLETLPAAGFNGIPVALLASSNPIGVIFSAAFIALLNVGGDAMQPEFSTEVINVIIALIVYFSAFSLLFKNLLTKWIVKKKNSKTYKLGSSSEELIKEEDKKLEEKQEESLTKEEVK